VIFFALKGIKNYRKRSHRTQNNTSSGSDWWNYVDDGTVDTFEQG
jgi:hypothetical protein